MVEPTKELIQKITEFKHRFHATVPTYQLPAETTEKDLIDAIDKSLKEGKNLLPDIFGYVR